METIGSNLQVPSQQPGELSPDQRSWWDGQRWLPVPSNIAAPQLFPTKTQVTLSAGTAFKIGFFGIMGAWVASIIPAVVLWVILIAGFASCMAATRGSG